MSVGGGVVSVFTCVCAGGGLPRGEDGKGDVCVVEGGLSERHRWVLI